MLSMRQFVVFIQRKESPFAIGCRNFSLVFGAVLAFRSVIAMAV